MQTHKPNPVAVWLGAGLTVFGSTAGVAAWYAAKVVFWYGVAVLVFRYAYGIELPVPRL